MYENLDKEVHEFYNNKYLRNRYPSMSYIRSVHSFVNDDSPDIAAVALGYKPAAYEVARKIKQPVNDFYLTKCYYRGFELLHINDDIVICKRCDFDKFREVFGKPKMDFNHREIGQLLGYPEHLIDLYEKCREGRILPDWDTYHAKAEEIALKLCMELD